jgi:nucleotide-binding universal stress UspA family protein
MKHQIYNVLHATNCESDEQGAVAHATRIALDARADLTVLHAISPEESLDWKSLPHFAPLLEQWRRAATPAGKPKGLKLHIEKVQQPGNDPVRTLADYVHSFPADLIVLSTHQREGAERWTHSVFAEPAARKARIPTLFVPAGKDGFVSRATGEVHIENVLVPVDRSPRPDPAIELACTLCRILGCPKVHFTFLHVGTERSMPLVEPALEPGWTMETSCWEGSVVDHIVSAAEGGNADLIVMATAGHHGFLDALRGSTTERVLRRVRQPLLAVPDVG